MMRLCPIRRALPTIGRQAFLLFPLGCEVVLWEIAFVSRSQRQSQRNRPDRQIQEAPALLSQSIAPIMAPVAEPVYPPRGPLGAALSSACSEKPLCLLRPYRRAMIGETWMRS